MRVYKVNGLEHRVFDSFDEVPNDLTITNNWRNSNVGDWVKADDGCYIQILRKGTMQTRGGKHRTRHYVGTCTGTFMCNKTVKMDTTKRENVWTISGKNTEKVIFDRKALTKHEIIFIKFLAGGMNMRDAYLTAFDTNNPKYATEQSAKLVKTERVQKAMKEELKPILKE